MTTYSTLLESADVNVGQTTALAASAPDLANYLNIGEMLAAAARGSKSDLQALQERLEIDFQSTADAICGNAGDFPTVMRTEYTRALIRLAIHGFPKPMPVVEPEEPLKLEDGMPFDVTVENRPFDVYEREKTFAVVDGQLYTGLTNQYAPRFAGRLTYNPNIYNPRYEEGLLNATQTPKAELDALCSVIAAGKHVTLIGHVDTEQATVVAGVLAKRLPYWLRDQTKVIPRSTGSDQIGTFDVEDDGDDEKAPTVIYPEMVYYTPMGNIAYQVWYGNNKHELVYMVADRLVVRDFLKSETRRFTFEHEIEREEKLDAKTGKTSKTVTMKRNTMKIPLDIEEDLRRAVDLYWAQKIIEERNFGGQTRHVGLRAGWVSDKMINKDTGLPIPLPDHSTYYAGPDSTSRFETHDESYMGISPEDAINSAIASADGDADSEYWVTLGEMDPGTAAYMSQNAGANLRNKTWVNPLDIILTRTAKLIEANKLKQRDANKLFIFERMANGQSVEEIERWACPLVRQVTHKTYDANTWEGPKPPLASPRLVCKVKTPLMAYLGLPWFVVLKDNTLLTPEQQLIVNTDNLPITWNRASLKQKAATPPGDPAPRKGHGYEPLVLNPMPKHPQEPMPALKPLSLTKSLTVWAKGEEKKPVAAKRWQDLTSWAA